MSVLAISILSQLVLRFDQIASTIISKMKIRFLQSLNVHCIHQTQQS